MTNTTPTTSKLIEQQSQFSRHPYAPALYTLDLAGISEPDHQLIKILP
ncbi:hypothetical protein [Paraburkholderia fynbosensis]|nr:hypothetical protein [Paraburkholderia fynbosensis]